MKLGVGDPVKVTVGGNGEKMVGHIKSKTYDSVTRDRTISVEVSSRSIGGSEDGSAAEAKEGKEFAGYRSTDQQLRMPATGLSLGREVSGIYHVKSHQVERQGAARELHKGNLFEVLIDESKCRSPVCELSASEECEGFCSHHFMENEEAQDAKTSNDGGPGGAGGGGNSNGSNTGNGGELGRTPLTDPDNDVDGTGEGDSSRPALFHVRVPRPGGRNMLFLQLYRRRGSNRKEDGVGESDGGAEVGNEAMSLVRQPIFASPTAQELKEAVLEAAQVRRKRSRDDSDGGGRILNSLKCTYKHTADSNRLPSTPVLLFRYGRSTNETNAAAASFRVAFRLF